MARDGIWNFSAGPSVMPLSVLEKAREELCDWNGSGMSIMEMSHRSALFQDIFSSVKAKLREVLSVPESHELLFLQGGATLQFSAIPMNLIRGGTADYAVTGNFSKKAAVEAEKYGRVNIAASSADTLFDRIPGQSELKLSRDAEYFYYCSNNTVYGTRWHYLPQTEAPLVCDMSSDILSGPVDVSKYGLIYAGAQKNMAPAGLTVLIMDKKLAGGHLPYTPEIMRYDTLIKNDSMLNTPPCWCIYMLGLTLDWIKQQGGLEGMKELREMRSGALYDYLDNSRLFKASAERLSRSEMNVTFTTGSKELDGEFVEGAEKLGLLNLKGHKVAGGMRASLYNAMPVEAVSALLDYMKKFEVQHHV